MSDALDAAFAEAIAADLEALARLHDREADAALLAALRTQSAAEWFAMSLASPEALEGARLIDEALAQTASLDDLAAEYAAIYLTHAYRVSPYESFWLDEENLERQQPMFDLRKWYRRFDLEVPDWRKRAEDHLAYELVFLARLVRDAAQGGPQTAASFLREHPLVWIPAFAARVVARCRDPFYAGAALLTAAYLERLAELFEKAFAIDMTIAARDASIQNSDGPRRPSCADPPAAYVPGVGPGW